MAITRRLKYEITDHMKLMNFILFIIWMG
jgi:hypothetical protein